MLDSAPGGVGIKNKEVYKAKGVKAVFQGGEKDEVADVFFHGYANYDAGVDQQFLKLTSCNTTGLIRAVDCLDKLVGLDRVAITIVRRVADPGDYHRGLTNALLVDKAPSHQAVDLMSIMPHIEATGILVHTPVTPVSYTHLDVYKRQVYEDERFAKGTKRIWQAIAASSGHSVLGGGDSVSAAHRFIDVSDIGFISSAGGAMVRFMTGKTLPLIEAMQKNYNKEFNIDG